MRLVKIEDETALPTPQVDINIDSTLEMYGGSEEDKVRVVSGLEPDYPAFQDAAKTFFGEYRAVETEFPDRVSDRPFGEYNRHEAPNDSNIEVTVFPGSSEEKEYSFSDWYQLRRESEDDLFNEVANSVLNNDRRLYWENIHQAAETAIDTEISENEFKNWLSEIERPQYDHLIRQSRDGDVSLFEEEGLYHEDMQSLTQAHIFGGHIMKGDREIGRVESEPDLEISRDVRPEGLENIEGIFVPQNHEGSLIEYLLRFN